jgi:hypothetical protein
MDDDDITSWDEPMTNSELAILMVLISLSVGFMVWLIRLMFF